jgi:hypothetical protein
MCVTVLVRDLEGCQMRLLHLTGSATLIWNTKVGYGWTRGGLGPWHMLCEGTGSLLVPRAVGVTPCDVL